VLNPARQVRDYPGPEAQGPERSAAPDVLGDSCTAEYNLTADRDEPRYVELSPERSTSLRWLPAEDSTAAGRRTFDIRPFNCLE
jgi:hypothetical protein